MIWRYVVGTRLAIPSLANHRRANPRTNASSSGEANHLVYVHLHPFVICWSQAALRWARHWFGGFLACCCEPASIPLCYLSHYIALKVSKSWIGHGAKVIPTRLTMSAIEASTVARLCTGCRRLLGQRRHTSGETAEPGAAEPCVEERRVVVTQLIQSMRPLHLSAGWCGSCTSAARPAGSGNQCVSVIPIYSDCRQAS